MLTKGRVTAGFYDLRPLSNPGEHVHGAVDIAQGWGGSPTVHSPVDGKLIARVIRRLQHGSWSKNEKAAIREDPVHNYFEDIYGGLLTIEEENGRYHIMTHFYPSQLHKRFGLTEYIETVDDSRWPTHMWFSKEIKVVKGEPLLPIGNAGFSTGPHLHWEIHHSRVLEPYADRLNPEVEFDLQ